ncbi:MAG TPA: SMP-30/gluconolactonase/LRE family protein [Acidimicrobiia bacterium]
MTFETLASGYGLVEGPTVDATGNLFFSDVLGGGVYRLGPDGSVATVVPKRRGVGGIALHAGGGLVMSGRDLVHVHDGHTRVVFGIEGLPGWNDLCTDSKGRVYAGALRFMVFDPGAEPVPGECWRVDTDGGATRLYGDVVHANGIALSPAEDRIYHSDTRSDVVHVYDLVGGEAVPAGRFAFPDRMPDGLAVDELGCVWVASAHAGCVVRLTPDGDVDRRLPVPAQLVTSLCFGGTDRRDLYVVTGDNTDDPELRGTVFRTRVDVAGTPVYPARV